MNSRSNTIANHFDKICLVLEMLGYLTGDGGSKVSESAGCSPGSMPSSTWLQPSALTPASSRA